MSEGTNAIEPVRRSVEVTCAVEEAFRIFTEGVDDWWPLATHSVGQQKAATCYFEGQVGGRIYESTEDGSLNLWGTVTEWEPPNRVVFTWHPGREPATAQEVELRFIEEGSGTRVELEHRGWETLGDAAAETREGYHSGWEYVLNQFIANCAS
jgi:uncharacterized protein YndB with AHSA1/START domain